MTPLAISLYVTACLHGTLHGEPKDLCHEFQIRSFFDATTCAVQAEIAAQEWLNGLYQIGIYAFLPPVDPWRCGAPTLEESD